MKKTDTSYGAYILDFDNNRGLALTSLFWVGAVLAALVAGLIKGASVGALLPYAGVALLPALASFALWPYLSREWAQALVILSWIAFAILACFAVGFVPMAILFLCAPLAAALFEREKVVEALVLSSIFAAVVFFMERGGYAPEPIADFVQGGWAKMAGIGAWLAFMVGAMYFTSSKTHADMGALSLEKSGFANAYPGAGFKFSPQGVLMAATQHGLSMFGLSENDYGFTTISNLDNAENDADLAGVFTQVRDTNEAVSAIQFSPNLGEYTDGVDQHYEFDFVPQDDGCVYIFATDCSQTVEKIQVLEEAQLSANKQFSEKTLFFAGVSHELRTPLNAIIGFSDMMRSRLFGPLPGKYAEYANLIHDSGQHMLDLIGDVLDMSKVEAGKYELNYDRFDIADVIRSSLKMVRPAADAAELTLSADIDVNNDLLIEADRRAVRQILLNLLSNAIKFTPKGGRINVSAKIVQGVLNLSVEDNGTGMSRTDLETVGQAYVQGGNAKMVDARGTGLGLSLVKNLVDLHEGRMALNAHPGAGTSANIYLPVMKPTQAVEQ